MRYLITFIWGLMFVTASIIALSDIILNYKNKEWYEFLLLIPIILALRHGIKTIEQITNFKN